MSFLQKSAENYDRLPAYVERALASRESGWRDEMAAIAGAVETVGRGHDLRAVPGESPGGPPSRSLYRTLGERFDRVLVQAAVEGCGGNKAEAARMIGVSYSAVLKKSVGAGRRGRG